MRFRIGRLMAVVAVIAAALALARSPAAWVIGLTPLTAGPLLGVLCAAWLRRWRRQAAVCLAATAVTPNHPGVYLNVFHQNLMGMLASFLAGIFLVPVILGSGWAWAGAVWREGRSRLATVAAGVLVLVLAAGPVSIFFTDWPMRLAFLASRPALERLADRAATGATMTAPEQAGVFLVIGSAVDPQTGNVGLITNAGGGNRSGFTRLPPGADPERRYGPFYNFNHEVNVGGRWWYQDED
ncbi:MAG: hypothetical protein U0835_24065 [Isosphaeraceae bacterium]